MATRTVRAGDQVARHPGGKRPGGNVGSRPGDRPGNRPIDPDYTAPGFRPGFRPGVLGTRPPIKLPGNVNLPNLRQPNFPRPGRNSDSRFRITPGIGKHLGSSTKTIKAGNLRRQLNLQPGLGL